MSVITVDQKKKVVNVKKTLGDTWKFRVTIKQSGVPIDISAYEFFMQVRHHRTNAILINLALGTGIEFTGDPGQIEVIVQTSALECNSYPYDLEFLRPDGYRRTPFGGNLELASQTTVV